MGGQIAAIIEYLEAAYTGARMADDAEAMDRISRAIIVMKTPADVNVFSDDFTKEYFKNELEG